MRQRHLRALVSMASQSGALLRVPTGSMRPSLRPGDMLAVERCSAAELRRGDVVVFERGGRMWAHRMIGRSRSGGRLIVKADSRLSPDPAVRPEEVLGRARYAVRSGGRIELSGRWARLKGLAMGLAYPAARAPFAGARAIYRRLGRNRGRGDRTRPSAPRVEIGGVCIQMTSSAPDLLDAALSLAGSAQPVLRGPAVRLTFRRVEVLAEAETPGGARRDGKVTTAWGPGFRLRIDTAARAAEALLDGSSDAAAVSAVMRNVATECAARAGHCVLHASCALLDGRAYVFAGPSGSGKTTCASMLPGATKVLDDLVFLGFTGGRPAALPSPDFDREGAGLVGVPVALGGVFALSGKSAAVARPDILRGASAAATLCSLPSPAAAAEGAALALEAAARIVSGVPVVRLPFGLSREQLGAAVEGLPGARG